MDLQIHVSISIFPVSFPIEFVKSGKQYHIHAWERRKLEKGWHRLLCCICQISLFSNHMAFGEGKVLGSNVI